MSNKNVIIVESPSKIKTLRKFLGGEYIVEASVGHIRDLPKKNLGLDNYKCYGRTAYTKLECETKTNEMGQKSIKGIWDRKCFYDSECPFYQKNKNYPNKRGGCIDGVCELPTGLKLLGKRFYDKTSIPICYNCKKLEMIKSIPKTVINGLECCSEQEKYKSKIGLTTPDYVFDDDFNSRFKFKDNFDKSGLSVY